VSGEFCKSLVRLFTQDADDITANTFVTPGLLVNLTPPEQRGSDFTFNLNTLESGTAPDDWMMMDWRNL